MQLRLYAFALSLLFCGALHAQGLSRAWTPENVGFSSERLARLSAAMQAGVDKGEIPGAIVVVGRNGRVAYQEKFGFRDREAKAPMEHDSIFAIASMTKPLVSLGIMMLMEEGRMSLADPVSRYLPELKDLKVGVEKPDASGKNALTLENARWQITIQDLLRHTSGITYGVFGRSMVKDLYNGAKMLDSGQTNAEMVSKLAKLPLAFHPGTTWDYGMSTDVLGRVIEVVSGMSLDRFLEERITRPLKMPDTGLWMAAAKHSRIAFAQANPETGKRPAVTDISQPRTFLSGGGGMASTAADYARFCQFLLNGGELDGVRLVSRKTIDLMTADHVPPDARYISGMNANAPGPENGQGFGLGFAVRVQAGRTIVPGTVGDYSWGGAWGTYFWVDPKERLYVVFMAQAPGEIRNHYRALLRNLVYQALLN